MLGGNGLGGESCNMLSDTNFVGEVCRPDLSIRGVAYTVTESGVSVRELTRRRRSCSGDGDSEGVELGFV